MRCRNAAVEISTHRFLTILVLWGGSDLHRAELNCWQSYWQIDYRNLSLHWYTRINMFYKIKNNTRLPCLGLWVHSSLSPIKKRSDHLKVELWEGIWQNGAPINDNHHEGPRIWRKMDFMDASNFLLWNFLCAFEWNSREKISMQKRCQTRWPSITTAFFLAADFLQVLVNKAKTMGLLKLPIPMQTDNDSQFYNMLMTLSLSWKGTQGKFFFSKLFFRTSLSPLVSKSIIASP